MRLGEDFNFIKGGCFLGLQRQIKLNSFKCKFSLNTGKGVSLCVWVGEGGGSITCWKRVQLLGIKFALRLREKIWELRVGLFTLWWATVLLLDYGASLLAHQQSSWCGIVTSIYAR